MFARTVADTEAIRALGSAHAARAADLSDVAAALSSLPIAPSMWGPIGARFVTALAEAAVDGAREAAALSRQLAASNAVAYSAAAAYDDTDHAVAGRIARV